MNKKAQALSLNAIIIAALAIIVLVLLAAIFTGRIGEFGKQTATAGTCTQLGGTWVDTACSTTHIQLYPLDTSGKGTNTYCCKPK